MANRYAVDQHVIVNKNKKDVKVKPDDGEYVVDVPNGTKGVVKVIYPAGERYRVFMESLGGTATFLESDLDPG